MNTDLHFSSVTDEWSTPQDLFEKLKAEFAFQLDVCAAAANTKCSLYFDRAQDGLKQTWSGVCWMNPPYGDPEEPCKLLSKRGKPLVCKKKRCKTCEEDPTEKCKQKKCSHRGHHIDVYVPGILDWVTKAAESASAGATVVCLLPARTDTEWWHEYVQPVIDGKRPGRVDFLRGRLKFGNAKNSAPFPSCIVVFKPAAPASHLPEVLNDIRKQ